MAGFIFLSNLCNLWITFFNINAFLNMIIIFSKSCNEFILALFYSSILQERMKSIITLSLSNIS